MIARARLALILCLGLALLSACGRGGEAPGSGTFVWIDVPVSGLTVPPGQSVHVEGHATSSNAVARVEIWVDGALAATISSLPVEGDLVRFYFDWTPPGAGEYTIQAICFDSGGAASEPDTTRVLVGEGAPTPVITLTPVVTVTPVVTDTPTSPPGATIQFWAAPPEIQAGACTTIRWHVENVQGVVFGGVQQPLDGSYQDCLCSAQRYTLTITHLDGSEEKRTVDIDVTGECVTPTLPPPPQDTTPPPAPSPAVPQNGLTLACKASQSLAWLPVDDPSGIAGYQVEVQRHSGDNNWQAVGGSPFTTAGKTVDVPVECGWYYRWRVRATDGAGNVGTWSGWSQFTVTLT